MAVTPPQTHADAVGVGVGVVIGEIFRGYKAATTGEQERAKAINEKTRPIR